MKLSHLLPFTLAALPLVSDVSAQNTETAGTVLTAEGISEFIDKKQRAPRLSVRVARDAGAAPKILADAAILNDEYKDYPIRFEFFVNRQLVATQLRSKELPGAVGIDVPATLATIPFNYSVIATILTPNRTFTTIINGAVFENDFSSTQFSSCTYTLSDTATIQDEALARRVYVANEVAVSQNDNSAVSVSFVTDTLQDGTENDLVDVSTTLTINGTTASGTIASSIEGNAQATATVSGTAVVGARGITSFSVESADKLTKLECR